MSVLNYFIQTVHSLIYIVAKCHFFSVVTWKDLIKYLQKQDGCTHFCEILYIERLLQFLLIFYIFWFHKFLFTWHVCILCIFIMYINTNAYMYIFKKNMLGLFLKKIWESHVFPCNGQLPRYFHSIHPNCRIFIKQPTRTNNVTLELCMYKASAKLL